MGAFMWHKGLKVPLYRKEPLPKPPTRAREVGAVPHFKNTGTRTA